MKSHIADAIKTTVNGKIDRMNNRLETYIKEDMEWKDNVKPIIDLGRDLKGFNKGLMYVLGILAAIGAGWGFIVFIATKIR